MSTPSTATATLPPHNPHYGYSHHQDYQSNSGAYRANNNLVPAAARPSSYGQHAPTTSLPSSRVVPAFPSRPAQSTSQTTSDDDGRQSAMTASQSSSRKRERSRDPDWNNFYKNGIPKEVIVIDDSPSPVPRIPDSTERQLAETSRSAHASHAAPPASSRHAAKKRKREDIYDPVYQAQSNGNAAYYDDSTSGSTSTDRTTSAQNTTAATSLGSQYSQGNGSSVYDLDDTQPGQKRKRVATRAQLANEAKKKKEIERHVDALSSYKPPPKPPIKAGDVHVKKVDDVCLPQLRLPGQKLMGRIELVYQRS